MNFEIDSKLIQNLFLKKALLRQGNKKHEEIKPLLLILSGAMRGVVGAGVTMALSQLGLHNVFDVVVGVSTGAGNAAYLLGGLRQSYIGAAVYYEDLANNFIRFTKSPIADIDYVEWIISDSPKKIDRQAVMNNRTKFFIAATEYDTGIGVLLNAKKSSATMTHAIKASIAMLGLYDKSVIVDDRVYIDGAIALPFPIEKVINQFSPTDVLVIANACESKATHVDLSFMERTVMNFLFRKSPEQLKNLAMVRHLQWIKGYNFFKNLSLNKGIIWSPDDINLLSRNSKKLKKAAFRAATETAEVFSKFKSELA